MQEKHYAPGYYVRQRLIKNKLAMAGLVVVLISILISLFGYLVMPDKTPYASEGSPVIKKQTPGFTVQYLLIRKNQTPKDVGIIEQLFVGVESPYSFRPISSYRIEGATLYYKLIDHDEEEEVPLINVVEPVFVGKTKALGGDHGQASELKGDVVRYVNTEGKVLERSLDGLIAQVKSENIGFRNYILGTDISGRDMLSRLIFGARISLAIGFLAVLVSLTLGITVGAIGGFFGGKIDAFVMWMMSIIWSIPGIMLVIAISLALHSRGILVAFIAVGLTMWVEVARVIRGQIKSLKEKEYIEAARALGYKNRRIIFRHILPNTFGPLIVIATSNFAAAILLEAGLSFLGLSVQPPTPSWGIMIYEGYKAIGTPNSWHLIILPAVAISFMVLAFNILGNGLRDAYDPKTLTR